MAESVISFVVQGISNLLIEEANLLWGVNQQVKQMEVELKRMQCFLKDADKRQHENETVKSWISDVRDAAYDAEDVIERFALRVASQEGRGIQNVLNRYACFFSECYSLLEASAELEDIKTKISDLTRSLQTYGINQISDGEGSSSISERQRQLRWSYSHIAEDHVVGHEESVNELVTHLINNEKYCPVACICGMGGLGKTTIAKKVYHHNDIRRNFEGFAWTYISQQCERRDIWECILLKLISPSKEERDEILKLKDEELAKKLYQVQQEKKCLVILDDIWSTETWDTLKPAFPDLNTRSKILLTTRNRGVPMHVDSSCFLYEPRCLNEGESWQLFQKKAFSGKHNSESKINKNMEKLGREMVARCSGLPLAIIVLGGLMATKDTLDEWEMVHGNMYSFLRKGQGFDSNSKLSELLALSYLELPCQLKPCFLHLSQFPEDFDIPTKKLIQLWVAEGIVSKTQHETEGEETLELVAERYLYDLINRCMVQVGGRGHSGNVKTCRLHDLMRDMCLLKAKEENFLQISCCQNGNEAIDRSFSSKLPKATTVKVRRLAIFLDQNIDEFIPLKHKKNPHLRSLIYFHARKCRLENWNPIITVLYNCKSLRILDLEGIKGLKREFPKEIGSLIQLRFLSLKKTGIRKVPASIGRLLCLQTLNVQTQDKVSWESTVQIPNVLWKMERLRHLYLPKQCGTGRLQLANLTKLQTLVNFPASKCDVNGLLRFTNLRKLALNDPRYFQRFGEIFTSPNCTFNYLRSLSLKTDLLSFPNVVVDVRVIVSGCPRLRKLHIEGLIENLPEYHQFPPYLTKLTLWGSRLVEDPMATLEKLPNLRVLDVREMFMGRGMVCCAEGFPQLKMLLLRGLPNLEEWTVNEGAMPSLCHLGIADCNTLEMVPDGLRFISTLQELEIRWMPRAFKRRLTEGGEDYHKVQHVPSIAFFN